MKEMFKGRRVGTLTAGIVLIAFGLLFLVRLFLPNIDYGFILSLWPIILVFMGIEMLVFFAGNKEEPMKYDMGAIALVIFLAFFAMVMAGAEFVLDNYLELKKLIL
jgi:uncharacterized membrane protein HdeD (DUF308 family)